MPDRSELLSILYVLNGLQESLGLVQGLFVLGLGIALGLIIAIAFFPATHPRMLVT